MRPVLLCLMLALPASAAPLDDLLRTPPWEVRAGDAAEALRPVIDEVRAADRHALDAWIEHPAGESPLGPRLLDDAAAALALDGFTHPIDPLDELPDPDLEPLRTLGRLLAADAIRLGREGRLGRRCRWRLRAAVRLGHHLGEAPGLTRVLVGVAVHQRVVQALEALASEPRSRTSRECPTSTTPSPTSRTSGSTCCPRRGRNSPDRRSTTRWCRTVREAVDAADGLDEATWNDLLHRLVLGLVEGVEPEEGQPLPPLSPAAEAALAAAGPLFEPAGRAATRADGPPSRLLIAGVLATWDRLRAEAWADTLLPYHQLRRRRLARKAAESAGTAPVRPLEEALLLPFVSTPLPALAAAADLDRRLRALQGAEALRLHAAREGRFPADTRRLRAAGAGRSVHRGDAPAYEVEPDGSAATLAQEDLPGDAPGRSCTHRLTLPER